MSNTPIIITGCQRSGTTLLNLILDAHPDVNGIDEAVFDFTKVKNYLNNEKYYPYVSWKLPRIAHEVDSIKAFGSVNTKVLWCLRDPRDVVTSMLKLPIKLDKDTFIPWAVHPLGADYEIRNCLPSIAKVSQISLKAHLLMYESIKRKPYETRSQNDAVFCGALCWRVKNELLEIYKSRSIDVKIVVYEEMICKPREVICKILEFIGLPWHENTLKHHLHHSGVSIGGTVNTRPIDSSNMNKWEKILSDNDLETIHEICSDLSTKLGYKINR